MRSACRLCGCSSPFRWSAPDCRVHIGMYAFVTEAAPILGSFDRIDEPPPPPPIAASREPPAWDAGPEPTPDSDLLGQRPEPGFEYDQGIAW